MTNNGREQANAILGTIMTKIFLPGLDDATPEYASKLLGDTTILSKTFQDFPGKKQDNTRYAEQKRALLLPTEIRQTAAHSEVLIISDTAPPIRAAYPPFAVSERSLSPAIKGSPKEIHLGEFEYQLSPNFPVQDARSTRDKKDEVEKIISSKVESICSEKRLYKLYPRDLQKKTKDSLEFSTD